MIEALGHYRLLERLGTGPLGDVYRARDTTHGRTAAVTLLDPSAAADPDTRHRVLLHGRRMAAISHPNIAAVYDAAEDGGLVYLAGEFLPGETLETMIAGRPLNRRRALDLAVQIADALAEAHSHGLVHQRLTPACVVVTPRGGVKVRDFGVASAMAEPASPGGDRASGIESGPDADVREDIRALGAILYEMLTGAPGPPRLDPPRADPLTAGGPRPMSGEVDSILMRLLGLGPEAPCASAALAAAALREAAEQLDARQAAATPAAPSPRTRHGRPGTGWLLGALLLAALAALVWLALDGR